MQLLRQERVVIVVVGEGHSNKTTFRPFHYIKAKKGVNCGNVIKDPKNACLISFFVKKMLL